jgi:hypothetical protein
LQTGDDEDRGCASSLDESCGPLQSFRLILRGGHFLDAVDSESRFLALDSGAGTCDMSADGMASYIWNISNCCPSDHGLNLELPS